MRHRARNHEQGGKIKPEKIKHRIGSAATTAELITAEPTGKHRARGLRIPSQTRPTHDTDVEAPAPVVAPSQATTSPAIPAQATTPPAITAPATPPQATTPSAITPPGGEAVIPDDAYWKASHLPHVIAGTLLALAVFGASGLGVRYAQSLASNDFVLLVVGLVVVVVLWAVMIATKPQVVSLQRNILTVANTGGSERFDLADPLQSVDLVGNPRTSHWAVLLHRSEDTTVVLRHTDVLACELDPIVRHYRSIADQRVSEREARFNR